MEIKKNKYNKKKGLYSTSYFAIGDLIFVLSGPEYDKPTRETIHVGHNVHIHDKFGEYMNHSFDPTTYINGCFVIAAKNINKGDELTYNYNLTEINMACPFELDGQLVCGKR
jgi:hypothetical protein